MRIGRLAAESGLTTKTIRYYESIGVLPSPERQSNGYRSYEADAVDRLAFVKDAQAAGLNLTDIQWILDLRDSGESTCGHTIGLLETHLADVDRQLIELGRTRSRLVRLIKDARTLDPSECTDPNRCQTIKPK
ncbi:MAG: heavy metal-responsive transcriptional regulator [Actinomycetota bacterium]|nr:heavy metal-responsive transcriptional regulator [Actinomycetota bacterium]